MEYPDYAIDFLFDEFNDAFTEWIEAGGPTMPAPRTTEDFERIHRRATCCRHGIKYADCPAGCHIVPPPYFGANE